MKILFTIAVISVLSSSGALACKPIQFGRVRVGQHVSGKTFAGLSSRCKLNGECVYGKRSEIEYVVEDNIVSEISAPVRFLRGLPMPGRRISPEYLRRVNQTFCPAFHLIRDDYGTARLETVDRIDPITRYSLRTIIYIDEHRTPFVSLTSLPET